MGVFGDLNFSKLTRGGGGGEEGFGKWKKSKISTPFQLLTISNTIFQGIMQSLYVSFQDTCMRQETPQPNTSIARQDDSEIMRFSHHDSIQGDRSIIFRRRRRGRG